MVKIDLITGFLGSGKTTFIKKYAQYLMSHGFHIGILENDYGAVNVDMMLLQDLMGEQCELEMISGGCDKETHIRRFRTKLISMGMCGYDRVIVEPSGIFDVDEFFDVLHEEPLDNWYEIGNVITIVDAGLENDLSQEADYLLASEAANAGRILLSHADEADGAQIEQTIAHLNRAMAQIGCKRRFDTEIVKKGTIQLTNSDLESFSRCGYVYENYQKMDLSEQNGFQSLYFMNSTMSEETLKAAVKKLFADMLSDGSFEVYWFDEAGTVNLSVVRSASDQITAIESITEKQAEEYRSALDIYEQNALIGLDDKVSEKVNNQFPEN